MFEFKKESVRTQSKTAEVKKTKTKRRRAKSESIDKTEKIRVSFSNHKQSTEKHEPSKSGLRKDQNHGYAANTDDAMVFNDHSNRASGQNFEKIHLALRNEVKMTSEEIILLKREMSTLLTQAIEKSAGFEENVSESEKLNFLRKFLE